MSLDVLVIDDESDIRNLINDFFSHKLLNFSNLKLVIILTIFQNIFQTSLSLKKMN